MSLSHFPMANCKSSDGIYLDTHYDSVNLIPYRAHGDTAIYYCSTFHVTETFMDVVRRRTFSGVLSASDITI